MRWKNNDINVALPVNIPRFRKLHDTGTPLQLSETVIERKETLLLKLLMKFFTYVWDAAG